MNYLLIFWVKHEGATIFLLEASTKEEANEIELASNEKDAASRETLSNLLMQKCYKSVHCEHNPSDTSVDGILQIRNFYP